MKAKMLLLPLLLSATSSLHADILSPTENSASYADKRLRYTAKLEKPAQPVNVKLNQTNDLKAAKSTDRFLVPKLTKSEIEKGATALPETTPKMKNISDLPLRELNESLQISFREKNLPSSIRSLTPPGWVVDLQIDKGLYETKVSFSGETTYQQALHDILKPQGLTFLAYRNMKPKPLIVVTHGGKK
ncbi:hypothetical protein LCGC14_0887810 [marine sediment metagenome]|uniref:Uncharacterized protein n=2 Tax=root TaxID=1 RepID=A0A0F9P506_9ZZZZ|nr:hypothetical protein [Methylophaga sp.]